MRTLARSVAFGSFLIVGLSCGAWAQDQPAAGSPPAAAPAQAQNAAPTQAKAPAEHGAAPAPAAEMPPPPPDGRRAPNPQRQARMMARRLALTAEQRAAIEPILAGRDRRIEKVRANAKLAPAMRRARVRRISRESVREINSLLTDAQRREYKKLRQERRDRRLQREQ